MGAPLFKIGDHVRVQGSFSRTPGEAFFDAIGHTAPKGTFEVVRVLPALDGGDRQYRVRGGHPPHERMVWERQLVHAEQPQPRR